MGKGKGSFDHWASRIAVNKIIFEVKGDLHEKVVRDAFRLAGNKMPGQSSLWLPGALFADLFSTQANTSLSRREILPLLELQN